MRISNQWVIPPVFKNCNNVLVCLTAFRTLNFWKTLTRANGALPSIIWFQWMPNEADLLCPGLPKWFAGALFAEQEVWSCQSNTKTVMLQTQQIFNHKSMRLGKSISNVIIWAAGPGFSSYKIFVYSNIKVLKVKMCVLTTKEVIMAARSRMYQ